MANIFGGVKGLVMKWLGIVPATSQVSLQIRENTTKEVNTLKNQVWYRGDPVELEQYFKQLSALSLDGVSVIPSTRFWAATPATNKLVRKIHSGLPRMIVNKLAEIVVNDMHDAEVDNGSTPAWKDIAIEVDFTELLKEAIQKTLSLGDGAFKICVDPTLSDKPLLEFYAGNDVEFTYKRGKLQEVMFTTPYVVGTRVYQLIEHYGKGYVNYNLCENNGSGKLGKDVPLNTCEETADLVNVKFDGDYIMAVPLKFYNSAKWQDRGDSIFEGKDDMFDAFDEVISTWVDAIRAGRVKQYIPENLVPRNADDGSLLTPDVFNNYLTKGSSLNEDEKAIIEVIQGKIEYDGLVTSYTTFLDCCLQGIISPSTLGIDVKSKDNAQSQREKEKTTLYTRDNLVKVLAKVLPVLIEAMLKTQDHMTKKQPDEYVATVEWGQYANPSFETMVETIGKAKVSQIMSTEQCVEELYGDTMDADDKAEEVARLKAEQSMATQVSEPNMQDDLNTKDIQDKPPAQ